MGPLTPKEWSELKRLTAEMMPLDSKGNVNVAGWKHPTKERRRRELERRLDWYGAPER